VQVAPETHYATTPDGAHIAYQVMGDGPIDLVVGFFTSLGLDFQVQGAHCGEFLRRLARFARVIRFDRRGTGMSDPLTTIDDNTLEQWADDAVVVLDAVGSKQPAIFAEGAGGRYSLLLAATHPERVSHLILFHSWPRLMAGPDYPIGLSSEEVERVHDETVRYLVSGDFPFSRTMPSVATDQSFQRWFLQAWRHAASPATMKMLVRLNTIDLRPVLPAIAAPALVLYRTSAAVLGRPEFSVYFGEHLRDARVVEVPGEDAMSFLGDVTRVVEEVELFLTGTRPKVEVDRVLATVLFTDIVGSTEHAARLGDKRWAELLDHHDDLIEGELNRHRGRKVNPTGDGMLATFDGPARAVRCAQAICEAVRPLGIEVRAGLHIGEVELRGGDIGGIAIHIGQRVSALAGPGEVLVSGTVKDLVVGSGIEFKDRGEHELKGVPGAWKLFAVKD
jgi:class 3 adenylate cyclase